MTQTAPQQDKINLNGSAVASPPDIEPDTVSSSITETEIPGIEIPQTEIPRPNPVSGARGLIFGIGIGIAIALFGNHILSGKQTKTPPRKLPPAASSTAPAQSVTVAAVEAAPISRTLKGIDGTVAPLGDIVSVMSQATGLQIKQVLVDEGMYVKTGQTMALLSEDRIQAQLTQAKAAVTQAEARLAQLKAGTRVEEIAQAQETVNSAQSGITEAQSDLDLARMRVQRNQMLQVEGAVARDRLDEVINLERSKRSDLEQAQSRLREAQQRLKQLVAGPLPEEITQAEAQLEQAKAQMQTYLVQLKDTRIVAPASGKVAERNARVGDVTSGSGELFKIIENGRLELLLKVPQIQLSQIRPGQEVQITSDANSKMRLSGTVREIDPILDEKTRQATVKVDLEEIGTLQPGMFLKAVITTGSYTGLTIPAKAIVSQPNGSAIVYVLQPDNTVKALTVEVGEILPGERVEIKSGLSAKDRIVIKGAPFIKDGDKVQVMTNVS
ncbi:efflux RND transporter periplasmic adaptor subunit [Limnofasciculus baicalensis]|uniref:Efflux RND transporter periplasmic adaptor subunit n=1 Tax=Limnofasciculus baicalensis BBK-W-15 TaxID=2699891 RepID=A0AAE3GUJ9_9CYAN|nr:efflux RND transporter periplasmic adaptor subunit [Limnofasciculus baicalensis]MCP2728842.1 efflux RND transporter periplasmic adaptor subunit [Limnofasciculus baicalensis BBK-W-15]